MTFAFRPIGGFIIGRIGDIMGRKYTIMLTSFIMAFTYLTMALIPTYTEIGIVATAVVMICRAFQGISSLGEGMGALIYTTEALRPPHRYIAIGIIDIFSVSGGLFALLISFLASSSTYGWRVAFIFALHSAFSFRSYCTISDFSPLRCLDLSNKSSLSLYNLILYHVFQLEY